MKSPAKSVPPDDRSTDLAYHWSGSAAIRACRMIRSRRSTSIDSPLGPAMPSRVLLNDTRRIRKPSANVTTTMITSGVSVGGWTAIITETHTSAATMNHGSVRGPSHRLPRNIGISSVL
jgi:hypothetical protein